jgi:hypothetical protein
MPEWKPGTKQGKVILTELVIQMGDDLIEGIDF